eukprot:m.283500 g.283500  ORF g.283500 m.283500 type:complete len:56 (+) comp40671_c0_seq5:799-966(+)
MAELSEIECFTISLDSLLALFRSLVGFLSLQYRRRDKMTATTMTMTTTRRLSLIC